MKLEELFKLKEGGKFYYYFYPARVIWTENTYDSEFRYFSLCFECEGKITTLTCSYPDPKTLTLPEFSSIC